MKRAKPDTTARRLKRIGAMVGDLAKLHGTASPVANAMVAQIIEEIDVLCLELHLNQNGNERAAIGATPSHLPFSN